MCVRLCFLKWIAADTFNSVEWKTLNHTTFRHSIQNNCVQNTEKVRSFGSGAYCASVQFTEQHYVQPHFIKVSPIRMELNYQSMCRPVESSTAGVDSLSTNLALMSHSAVSRYRSANGMYTCNSSSNWFRIWEHPGEWGMCERGKTDHWKLLRHRLESLNLVSCLS